MRLMAGLAFGLRRPIRGLVPVLQMLLLALPFAGGTYLLVNLTRIALRFPRSISRRTPRTPADGRAPEPQPTVSAP